MAAISQINIYPIKSCAGVSLEEARITCAGLDLDRAWMIVDSKGVFCTQRKYPEMSLIAPRIDAEALTLTAPGFPDLAVPLAGAALAGREVRVWSDRLPALDEGAGASQWLTRYFRERCGAAAEDFGLVRFDSAVTRSADEKFDERPAQVRFADSSSILVITEESLERLNAARIADGKHSVGMNRFRPNIVIASAGVSWDRRVKHEDSIETLSLGDRIELGFVASCKRCGIVNVRQEDAAVDPKGDGPLADLKLDDYKFGHYAVLLRGEGETLRLWEGCDVKLAEG